MQSIPWLCLDFYMSFCHLLLRHLYLQDACTRCLTITYTHECIMYMQGVAILHLMLGHTFYDTPSLLVATYRYAGSYVYLFMVATCFLSVQSITSYS